MNLLGILLTFLAIFLFPARTHVSASALAPKAAMQHVGSVLLIGGGKTPPPAVRAFLKAAGGTEAPIVVLAQTEENAREDAPLSAAQFREQGATHVEAPVDLPPAQIIALLAQVKGVWIPGGDQNRFMKIFPEASGIPAAIRAVYQRGGVVGGTSAGASLMGDLMPTGEKTDSSGLEVGACPVQPGLRVLPNTIIDQHFLVRNRVLRLLSAVLEHPHSVARNIQCEE